MSSGRSNHSSNIRRRTSSFCKNKTHVTFTRSSEERHPGVLLSLGYPQSIPNLTTTTVSSPVQSELTHEGASLYIHLHEHDLLNNRKCARAICRRCLQRQSARSGKALLPFGNESRIREVRIHCHCTYLNFNSRRRHHGR